MVFPLITSLARHTLSCSIGPLSRGIAKRNSLFEDTAEAMTLLVPTTGIWRDGGHHDAVVDDDDVSVLFSTGDHRTRVAAITLENMAEGVFEQRKICFNSAVLTKDFLGILIASGRFENILLL